MTGEACYFTAPHGSGVPLVLLRVRRLAIKEESSTGALRWQVEQGSSGGWLTAQEVEVLCYLALGWDIANIATEMGLSPHTVRNHSTNLRRKLDVRSSLEAVMAAVRMGVLRFEEERRGTDEK